MLAISGLACVLMKLYACAVVSMLHNLLSPSMVLGDTDIDIFVNPLAPELFLKFLHTLYLKCE
jgi:hypothetical protein